MHYAEDQLFEEIVEKLESIVTEYKNKNIFQKRTKYYLANGDTISYIVPKDKIAHLLGINFDILRAKGILYSTNSYAGINELISKKDKIGSLIFNREISLKDIFSPNIQQKMNCFFENIKIDYKNVDLVCVYDDSTAINQGEIQRNCDYIIIKSNEKGQYLTLDLVKDEKYCVPKSSRFYENEKEAKEALSKILSKQKITFITGFSPIKEYTDAKTFYLKDNVKENIFNTLKLYKEENDSIIDVSYDYGFMIKSKKKSQGFSNAEKDIYDYIVDALTNGLIIKKGEIENYEMLSEGCIKAINCVNDFIANNSNNIIAKESYSSIEEKLKNLQNSKKEIEIRNKELRKEVEEKDKQIDSLKEDNNKLAEDNTVKQKILEHIHGCVEDYKKRTDK